MTAINTIVKASNNSAATQVFDFSDLNVVYAAAKNSSYTVAPLLASMVLKAHSQPYMNLSGEEQYPADDAQQAAMVATAMSLTISTMIKQMAQGNVLEVASVEEVSLKQLSLIIEANPDVQIVNTEMLDIVRAMHASGIVSLVSDDERSADSLLVIPTREAYNHFFKVSALVPQYAPITKVTDRRTRQASAGSKEQHLAGLAVVKGGKVKPNFMLKKAIDFLQATPYMVDEEQLVILNLLYADKSLEGNTTIKSNKFVVDACNTIDAAEYLYAEHGTCKRGRIMPLCFGGPNLQSADLCRSLYNVVSTQPVLADHIGVTFFKNEMREAAGFALSMGIIKNIAANPVGFLTDCLNGLVPADEPFKLVKMCREWIKAQAAWAKGEGFIFTTPVGLDAKSSGTQILAILAGDAKIADACGITNVLRTDKERKQVDMYAVSGQEVNKATKYTYTRNDMKTPYMAIQYGGSWKAIAKQKAFKDTCASQGLYGNEEVEQMAKVCATVIKETLGYKINGLIASIEYNVHQMCEEQNIEGFQYKHLDGFTVSLSDTRKISAGWAGNINITRGNVMAKPVAFGNINPETNLGTWQVSVGTSRGEFVRKFVVHLVQGIDAMLARTVAAKAKDANIEGYATIHDCFRTCVADADKLLPIIQASYLDLFTEGKIIAKLEEQIGKLTGFVDSEGAWVPYSVAAPIDAAMYTAPNSYYFC